MKKVNGFGLLSIILIIVITAVVSSLATGVVMVNNSELNNCTELTDDEDLQEFISLYNTLLDKYYDSIDSGEMLSAAEEAMMDYLDDKYTTYLDDSEYEAIIDELSSTYKGIGVSIQGNVVVTVTEAGPASDAGIQEGDIILAINDTDVTEMTGSEISNIIKETTEDSVEITIQRDEEVLYFVVTLEELDKSVSYMVIDNSSIGYIYIENFSENLDEQVESALNSLESAGITSLIIDLRDNVGGYLSAAESTSSLFLSEGKIIYSLETSSNTYVYKDETKESRSYPIVVLINGNTASAAEIMASALQESYGATLVGAKSYGKGKVQQVISLSSGDSVKYTTAKWLTPSGDCIDGVGIYPDYTVIYEEGETYDSQIQKAIDLLS